MAGRKSKQEDPAERAYLDGSAVLVQHPLFSTLLGKIRILRGHRDGVALSSSGWSVARNVEPGFGEVFLHPKRRGSPEEWAWVLGINALRFGFDHFRPMANEAAWIAASTVTAARFLADIKIGAPPGGFLPDLSRLPKTEEALYRHFCANDIPEDVRNLGLNGALPDMDFSPVKRIMSRRGHPSWPQTFADGLNQAVSRAVLVAGGELSSITERETAKANGEKARQWFIDHYPLLGGVAAGFRIVCDPELCRALDIGIAAVDIADATIYLNPAAGLTFQESVFVVAHEILHAGLRHDLRRQGRDHEIFNVACDFVVNRWLVQMNVGDMPAGVLYDTKFDGLSAEEIYDILISNMRQAKKFLTLRNRAGGDIISKGRDGTVSVDMDEFCRRALAHGLALHQETGRGFLPAGLIDEIRALTQPPVPWEVELGRWFDDHFEAIERERSWRRTSRRQEAIPDTPRPALLYNQEEKDARTFGVVLDTSMSMDREILGKAIGQIAAYAAAKDVRRVRVVFCDAHAYDQGYIDIMDLAGRVRVVGRGGTVLQPAITLLQNAKDYPETAPIMIITDGECDTLNIRREHCFILPDGGKLPFKARGSIFHIK